MTTESLFLADPECRRFPDVLNNKHIDFRKTVLAFLDDTEGQKRLVIAEKHFKLPALAGVVVELEAQPEVRSYFASNKGQDVVRFKQAVGKPCVCAWSRTAIAEQGVKESSAHV